ncbi:MAG: DUF421 domain-containing protein [Pseudobacter sp.]|uniref:DUF421 domain-containing protein n=1 Tax=Pseudobacter sp. TaxID=2045420 RepID=UPI003F8055CD
MKKESIYLDDLMRILRGNVPWEFYIELIIRSLAVYLILVFAFRLMGKRLSSRLTRTELAAVASLAAAIGIPLQQPDRGLLPGLLVAVIVVIIQRFVSSRAAKSRTFEKATQGTMSILVKDGKLQLEALKRCHMSRERIFCRLRSHSIRHLGEVKRLYLEANGSFTVINETGPGPGLCILPEVDQDFINELPLSAVEVCSYCGNARQQHEVHCRSCHHEEWVNARGRA